MPNDGYGSGFKVWKKLWRYPSTDIPWRLKNKYTLDLREVRPLK